ncbi:MAG: DedA family protein [Gammaproteobacteria bacterium]|nr:MAG: DedA family protein [Gammaproteobacteria bacterium]
MDFISIPWAPASLFVSAFVSSTLFPGGSEALLISLCLQQPEKIPLYVVVATIGNTLGGMTSWGLGYFFAQRFHQRPQSHSSHQRAMAWLQKYGSPILLLSWLPVIGDPLCLAAGLVRQSWLPVILFIFIGKFLRYAVLAWVV